MANITETYQSIFAKGQSDQPCRSGVSTLSDLQRHLSFVEAKNVEEGVTYMRILLMDTLEANFLDKSQTRKWLCGH